MEIISFTDIQWLNDVTNFFLNLGESHGYLNFFLGMALESLGIPFASVPATVSTSVFLTEGKFNIYLVILVGALGNVLGSTFQYALGRFFGETIRKFKKDHTVFKNEERLEKYTKKYGPRAIIFAQLVGVTRVFISFPAGILKMNFRKFILATFFGGLLFTTWYVMISFILRDFYDKFVYPYIGISFATVLVMAGLIFAGTHIGLKYGKKAHRKIKKKIIENGQDNSA